MVKEDLKEKIVAMFITIIFLAIIPLVIIFILLLPIMILSIIGIAIFIDIVNWIYVDRKKIKIFIKKKYREIIQYIKNKRI